MYASVFFYKKLMLKLFYHTIHNLTTQHTTSQHNLTAQYITVLLNTLSHHTLHHPTTQFQYLYNLLYNLQYPHNGTDGLQLAPLK